MDSNQQWEESTYLPVVGVDRLRFHHRCGSMVKLSASQRTSERRRPLDEFNNGVVMTQRPLLPDELFEIRIESLVDKWSGSIEVGITTHNPATLDFPSTMTNLRSGTVRKYLIFPVSVSIERETSSSDYDVRVRNLNQWQRDKARVWELQPGRIGGRRPNRSDP